MTKTPTMSVRYEEQQDFVGGAGIVAKHLRSAGADVTFSTVLGDDQLGRFTLDDLAKAGVKCLPIVDRTRVTTNKNAIIAGGYRLLKIIPMAWLFECRVAPPLWVHVVLWGVVALGMIALVLPTVKAFLILLEHHHRRQD